MDRLARIAGEGLSGLRESLAAYVAESYLRPAVACSPGRAAWLEALVSSPTGFSSTDSRGTPVGGKVAPSEDGSRVKVRWTLPRERMRSTISWPTIAAPC